MIWVSPEGRKVGSLKRLVRSQLARWEMKSCTPFWREAHLQVKMHKTPQLRTTFGSWAVEKVHAVVARSIFPSENVQNTPCTDHFWKLRCRKSARRCGAKHISKSKCTKHTNVGPLFGSWDVEKVHAVVARSTFRSQNALNTPCTDHFWRFRCRKSACRCGAKHISKSKCTKHTIVGPLLEVEMSKKCTPLWREAHFEVKMSHHVRTIFGGSDVEKVHAVVARSTFRSQNGENTRGSDHFWRFRCRFASLHYTTLHYTTLHSTTLHSTTLHYTTLQLHNYTPLHSTTLNCTTLHYITLHSTTLHYTTLHYLALHFTTLHYTTLQYEYNYDYATTLHYTTLHYTTLNYTTLHYTTLHSTTLHYITLHYTTLHYTSLHYTTLHSNTNITTTTQLHSTTLLYITLHYITLHYTTFHHTPLHYTPLHYTTLHWMTLHHR